ncbi:hypothetical protein [Streptomyces sp. NPDC013455]|uniref:hypothetical protein n=1 Tax=Streptomyces sp. NPDC013455 TaxID=3155605 RepID=UPI0033E00BD8
MRKLTRTAALAVCVAAGAGPAVVPAHAAAGEHPGAVHTVQSGHVLACHGQSGERSVAVELYGNSFYGNVVSVSVEGPDGQYGGGTNPASLFGDGTVAADVPLERLGEEGGDAVGTASVGGTYTAVGDPVRVHDVYREPGWNVVSTGTNQRLAARVTVAVFGETVSLTCGDAFAFDLRVTKTPS